MGISAFNRWTILGEGLASLLDEAVGAFALQDDDGRIVDWNRAAELMFGWSREEAAEADAVELLAPLDERAAWRCALRQVLTSDSAGGPGQRVELRANHRTGREVPIELVLSVVEGRDRRLVATFFYDISERKQAQERRRRFEAIVASSGEAILSASADGTIESWNPAAERLYGYSSGEMIGVSVKRLLPAGSFHGFGPEIQALTNGESLALELTELRKDGVALEVATTVSPLFDDRRAITGLVSIMHDVTERNHSEARLAEANSRFAGAFDAASTGMALVAPDGRFLEVNPALCELLHRDADTLLASTFQELTHPDDLAPSLHQLKQALAGKIERFQQSKRYLLPDGGIVWGLLTLTVVDVADGALLYFVAQIQDITARKTAEGELRRYAAQLESLSEHDPLTGLSNQGVFEAALEEELSMLTAGGGPCSVLLASVQAEDPAVIAVAESLQGASRESDLVAHLGAGEFAVLLPGVDIPAAAAILERTRDALAAHGDVRFSGVTAMDNDTVDALMARLRDELARANAGSRTPAPVHVPTGIGRLLELARRQLGMPLSFLCRLDGDGYVFARFAGDHEQFGLAEGATVPLADTPCQRMLAGRIGWAVADLADEPEPRHLNLTTSFSLRAYAGVPVRLRSGEIYGTLCAVDSKPHPELSDRHRELMGFLGELAAELIEDDAEQQAARRTEVGATGMRALLVALEARDLYTGEHSKKVVALASAVARSLGLDESATADVQQVALLHDIGKVGIPDAILQKQGPLDAQEWQLMRQHPVVGERIIAGTPGLSHLAPAMRAEHERWDGGGYPDGLAGEQIPLASRITLACDALHALTSDRPYRPAMTLHHAREELRSCAGRQFDPQVIEALLAEVEAPDALAVSAAGGS